MRPLLMTLSLLILSLTAFSQDNEEKKSRIYSSSSGEMIFSWANVMDGDFENGSVVRWTPFFNMQVYANYDPASFFGMFGGLSVQNVGFIYDIRDEQNQRTDTRKKFRSYNLGIPVGLKIGKMDGVLMYGGYELAFPFTYKEKTFVNERKTDKFLVWFSDRTPTYTQAVFGGIDLDGINFKFKYYLDDFFNEDYTETDPAGDKVKPYENFNARLFYISVTFEMFKKNENYYRNSSSSFKNS